MPITKRNIIDKVELLMESGDIQVREATVIEEDGVELSRSYHRRVIPSAASTTNEPTVLRELKAAVVKEKSK